MRSAAQLVIPVIVPRALILWGLIRLAFAMLPLAGGESIGSMSVSPVGVVMLSCFVGLLDVRARGERILWANLGVSPLGICGACLVATIPAEFIFAFVSR